MEAARFGELDPDLEDDFSALLAPRKKVEAPEPAKKSSTPAAAKKAPEKPKKATESDSPTSSGQDNHLAPVAPEQPAAKPARRSRPPKSGGAKVAATQSASSPLVLWTPSSIRSRMQAYRVSIGTQYRDQVLDALEATVDELPALVAAKSAPREVEGKLFSREVAPAESSPADDPRMQLTIRGFLQSQLEVIDSLVEQAEAGSRSKLINTALDNFLPQS